LGRFLARDRFWNLSKQWSGFSHQFLTLRDGFKFHYVTNDVPSIRTPTTTSRPDRPLVILLHGFPDSWALWRHIIGSTWLRESSSLVAVDLPGYGGSDRLGKYTATEVLEKLTEFIVAVRERYEIDKETSANPTGRVIIVGHDWGCVLGMRLAADAPQLADRFILTNGPIVSKKALQL
jgi:pimeloyl-ACP methyl ester carboxylesterase